MCRKRITIKDLQQQIDLLRNSLDNSKEKLINLDRDNKSLLEKHSQTLNELAEKNIVIEQLQQQLAIETTTKNKLLDANVNLSNTLIAFTNKYI